MARAITRIDHSILGEPRSSGVLLHPTSLPGSYGIGTIGDEAVGFIDFLVRAGQRLWQVCPLGPTGYGDSPYQCFSAFAGNPLLIGLEPLVRAGHLPEDALGDDSPDRAHGARAGSSVDYGVLIPWKLGVLKSAFDRFVGTASPSDRGKLARFEQLNRDWLDDYALFAALKDAHDGRPWSEWPAEFRDREPAAIERFSDEHSERIALTKYLQWVFHTQWYALRAVASVHGVRIVGDLPIFVAHDSADVWAHR
ncbi:MAG: 4-alpha-glucanotransferase, partial [Spirochaetaceae bacterium]